MSHEGARQSNGGRDGARSMGGPAFPPPFYPLMGYQGPPHLWLPPNTPARVPTPWNPLWRPVGYPAPTTQWSAHPGHVTIANTGNTAAAPDEYTVDTVRGVYKDDDARLEIQRVKVHRRHPESGLTAMEGPETMSVVPAACNFPGNERRPPPRKNRRKQEVHMATMGPGPFPWYPCMPYLPYPYPYPYYFPGCVWPSGAPSDSVSWSGNESTERVLSRQDSNVNSQNLESCASISSVPPHSSSPTADSQITDNFSIAPSDSVSVRDRKRDASLERVLFGPKPPPRNRSRASSSLGGSKSDDVGKTREWMLEMKRALRKSGEVDVRDPTKDSLCETVELIYKKIPPVRKRRKLRLDNRSDKSSLTDLKDIDDMSEQKSVFSDTAFDDSTLGSELSYAFKKFERSVNAFTTELATEHSPLHSRDASPSMEISQSSGDATPTEALTMPLSDICDLAEDTRGEGSNRVRHFERPRAISESISSPPSREASRTVSVPDVSLHPNYPNSHKNHKYVSPSHQTEPLPTTLTTTLHVNAVRQEENIPHPDSSLCINSNQQDDQQVRSVSAESIQVPKNNQTASKTPQEPLALVITETTNGIQCTSAPQSSKTETLGTEVAATETISRETDSGVSKTRMIEDKTELQVDKADRKGDTSKVPTTQGHDTPEEEIAEMPSKVSGEGPREVSRRNSQTSSATTFFSTRTAEDSHALDTDSTDIALPTTDSMTADENEESPSSVGLEDERPWVLQRTGEAPILTVSEGEDERRNAWRAEVSLWRARLVVSLSRGLGLDRQDWGILHLMVLHPLSLDLKLSLLHAPRLCAANSNMGPAVLRVALIQLSQYGETLLQREDTRQPGWRVVRLDEGHAWAPVKGAVEILQSLGYQERGDGMELRHSRRYCPEASVIARLTLDMIVLAEEFRFFLTGTHQYPNNVSDLFYSDSIIRIASDLPQRPPSTEGSFVSAMSEAVPVTKHENKSHVTNEDTRTSSLGKKLLTPHDTITSSPMPEEITLRDDNIKASSKDTEKTEESKADNTHHIVKEADSESNQQEQQVANEISDSVQLSSHTTSLSDPQSSQSSAEHHIQSGSELSSGNETVIPVRAPTPPIEGAPTPKPREKKTSLHTPTTAASSDNPDDHVYEEIDVVRGQMLSIRASSVPTGKTPPPLPPKTKVNTGGEDESGLSLTYPKVEWSSISMPGSLRGGSTGAKRKKRRAPMPPEFMPPDWKQSQEIPKNEDVEPKTTESVSIEPNKSKGNEYRRSLNPFYEEIDSVQDEVKKIEDSEEADETNKSADRTIDENPFVINKRKATGYIGKNPFYDDVEILKKRDNPEDIKPEPSNMETKNESTPATDISASPKSEPPVVRPKRRAPRPPPTPESSRKLSPHTQDGGTTQQQTPVEPQCTQITSVCEGEETRHVLVSQSTKDIEQFENETITSDKSEPTTIQVKTESNISTPLQVESDPQPVPDDKSMTIKNTSLPSASRDTYQEGAETSQSSTPKFNRAIRPSLAHPKAPPPPPPPFTSSGVTLETSIKDHKEDTPPPIPPPKAPLSLLDEIPYMDDYDVKELKSQNKHLDSTTHFNESETVITPAHTSNSLPRQPLVQTANAPSKPDLPPTCPPPLPPCPPPESPPETPHNSPPETPHVSPPETPHNSPPPTPPPSPRMTQRLAPNHSSIPQFHHQKDDDDGGGGGRASMNENEEGAPPIPPKLFVDENSENDAPPIPPKSMQLVNPCPLTLLEPAASNRNNQKSLSVTSSPVTTRHSVQSTVSEERYEIPDTSRAPPPRPVVQTPPKTKVTAQESSGQRVLAAPEGNDRGTRAGEAEERYDIPEVLKEPSLKRGVNGAPRAITPSNTTTRRGDMEAVFGPPKPPLRRRHHHSPPPRPPKHPGFTDRDTKGGFRSPSSNSSCTSSLSSSSNPISLRQEEEEASIHPSKTPKRRSWPFLLCDCLYANCCNNEDADK